MRFLFAILILTVQARASLILDSCSRNHPIITSVTDASVTPSTNKVAVCAGWNGLRVWTGYTPIEEAYYDLYVSVNGAAATKVRVFRWKGYILAPLTSGDNLSLGTADGRTVYVTPMYAPATVETVTGTTGTANCDKAGPPLWTPTTAHINLPANARAFSIAATSTNLDLFIAEYDGSAWTPLRWIRTETGRATTVRTSYRKIALANYAGTAVSVTGPLGTVIGGTSVPMSLTFPAITGTSRSVNDVATLKTAIAAAVAGDEIVLDDATYALDVNLTHGSFTANEAAGNIGFEGITFRSASGNRAACIISRSADNTGGWIMDQRNSTGKTTYFKDLTFDETCVASSDAGAYGLRFNACSVTMQNCRITGINLKDSDGEGVLYFMAYSSNLVNNISLLNCQFDTQSGRLLNFSGCQTLASTNYGTRQVISTDVFTGGTTAGLHHVIAIYNIAVGIYGGLIYDTQQYAVGVGYRGAPHFFFTQFPQAATTARSVNTIVGSTLFGCNWTTYAGALSPSDVADRANSQATWYWNNYLRQINASAGFQMLGGTASVGYEAGANIVIMNLGQFAWLANSGSTFINNIFQNAGYVFRNVAYTGAKTQPLVSLWNTASNSTVVAIMSTNNQFAVNLTNNATVTSATSISTDVNGMAVIAGDYNVFDPTVTGYVAGAHDITNANAAIDTSGFPTASGNCDAVGANAAVDWVGGSDPFGLVTIYGPSQCSIGARAIPKIYAGAILYPEIW